MPAINVGRNRALMLGLALTALLGGGVASGATKLAPLVPSGQLVAGRGYGHWDAAAWRWRLAQPDTPSNPSSCLTSGQRGPVWFLGSSSNSSTLTCSIPAGKYVMLSTPSVDCSTIEPRPFHARTDAGLMRCASRRWRRNEGGLTVTLDGVTLQPSGYVGATGAFGFTMPAQNNFLRLTGQSRGRMAVFGAASILRPLRPGTHTLVQAFSYAHTSIYVKVTYRLTVG